MGDLELEPPSLNALNGICLAHCVVADAWPVWRHNLSWTQKQLPQEAIIKEINHKHESDTAHEIKANLKLLPVDASEGNPKKTVKIDEVPTKTNKRRREINTVDLYEAKWVKMKLLILQDKTLQEDPTRTSNNLSTRFYFHQIPWQLMARVQDIQDDLLGGTYTSRKLPYCTPDGIKLQFYVRMGLHKP